MINTGAARRKSHALFLLLTVVLFCVLSACSRRNRTEIPEIRTVPEFDGVNVGNGFASERLATYASPHRFKITYAASLKLVHTDDHRSVIIDNSPLISRQARSSPISTTEFTVVPPQGGASAVSSFSDLEDQLRALRKFALARGERSLFNVRFLGAFGVAWEERTPNRVEAKYYLLTQSLTLVMVTVKAYSAAKGIAWVAPIVNTFVHDVTPPVVHEFNVFPSTLRAGGTGELRFRATDDISGIAESTERCSRFVPLSSKGKVTANQAIPVCGKIRSLGEDWYSVKFTVNRYRPSGVYLLYYFSLTDRAGNRSRVAANLTRPLATLTVINDQLADVTPPEVQALEADRAPVVAGRRARFKFRATDDVSGLTDSKGGACVEFQPVQPVADARLRQAVHECGRIQRLHDHWYFVEASISRFRPSGTYYVSAFSLRDVSGNEVVLRYDSASPPSSSAVLVPDSETKGELRTVPVPRLNVVNEWGADVTPPVLHHLKISPRFLRAGEAGEVVFKVTDDLSGISIDQEGCHKIYAWVTVAGDRYESSVRVCGKLRSKGNDWYGIPFHVNPYRPVGEYGLYSFAISDRAGNTTSVLAEVGPEGEFAPNYLLKGADGIYAPSRLRIPFLHVIR